MEHILSKKWLIHFRWYLFTLIFAVYVFSNYLNFKANSSILFFIVAIAISNFYLTFRSKISTNENSLLSILLFDIILISLILNSSGGATNPFSILFLLYVVFSAILLKPTYTFIVVLTSITCFGILLKNVPEHHMHGSGDYFDHLTGMWIAYSVVALICSFTISTLSNLLKENLIKNEVLSNSHLRLKSLTTLSAGAAHELRTPLNTISLCLDDLKFLAPKEDKKIMTQLDLISSQVNRCIQIIKDLSLKSGEIEGENFTEVKLKEFLNDTIKSFSNKLIILESNEDLRKNIQIPKQAVEKALKSLIQNALESSSEPKINIRSSFDNETLAIEITDNGPGILPEIRPRLGEPFVTSKAPGNGMGLGVFIAKLTATCYGGDLTFESEQSIGTKACFTIRTKIS